jgi:hypothetical protein
MKQLSLLFALLLCSSFASIRSVSGATSVTTSDDNNIVIATGSDATFTLGTVSNGFTVTLINHGTGTITFSQNVYVGGGKTITTLGNYPAEMQPGWVGNTIQLCYDGTTWRAY